MKGTYVFPSGSTKEAICYLAKTKSQSLPFFSFFTLSHRLFCFVIQEENTNKTFCHSPSWLFFLCPAWKTKSSVWERPAIH